MAPILSKATGVMPQVVDDPLLVELKASLDMLRLEGIDLHEPLTADAAPPLQDLVALLEPYDHKGWMFEEQIDLYEWIHVLNVIDVCIRWALLDNPYLLLMEPVDRELPSYPKPTVQLAETMEHVRTVSPEVCHQLCTILRFTAGILRNCVAKSLYNSVEELVDLLACVDDQVADCALGCLQALSLPPALHKQQVPEVNSHSTSLHNTAKMSCHARLTALARGWGTRALGLGLYTVVTADDSVHGQGNLPAEAARQVSFSFYPRVLRTSDDAMDDEGGEKEDREELSSELVSVTLTEADIVSDSEISALASSKRQKVKNADNAAPTTAKRNTKSAAELFLMAIERAGGRARVPQARLFGLLTDIRLARSFYSRDKRLEGVERRLRALITILHAHPSAEIMSGYFQAQPELCVEIVDLLRITVSSANMTVSQPREESIGLKQDIISTLATDEVVPYHIRMLALEALTALISRRDGSTGALAGTARLSSVLTELGVGKGHYLGFVPTLMRYSLAALTPNEKDDGDDVLMDDANGDSLGFDFGLAFVKATMAPQLPRIQQVERALDFIDNVLLLTSAIVSTPTGTSALTDCGLIPALLSVVAMDVDKIARNVLADTDSESADEICRIHSLVRFVIAQAVQILEGAIVTHNHALSAFHDLEGVDALTNSLAREIAMISRADEMDVDERPSSVLGLRSSKRVMLFSIVTCLTVVFHQESTSASTATPAGGEQLRREALSGAVISILDNADSFGGHLGSLVATLLADIMNSDPHVVRHVHESGMADSFLNMIVTCKNGAPVLPPVPELVMAIPNVISALALTEDGAKAVAKKNPFPALVRLFHHPKYAMPNSRCLLNELPAIIGTGLDDIMRHVELLKPLIFKAVTKAIDEVVAFSDDLALREETAFGVPTCPVAHQDVECDRTYLIQYVLSFGQMLEQILHNDDHCEPFVDAGGLDALLRLFPASMPTGFQFLSHLSSISALAVTTAHHSTIEDSLSIAIKSIEARYDPVALFRKVAGVARRLLKCAEDSRKELEGNDGKLLLENFPQHALHLVVSRQECKTTRSIAKFLRDAVQVQWITGLLASAVRAANQRSQETGGLWSQVEQEWKKELSSEDFISLLASLSTFHHDSLIEVCRVRSLAKYESEEKERHTKSSPGVRFRIRIVCAEGAIVRDGIEIDSCASVGSMDMGEIVEAYERCINSSGILRYRTQRGWVSEMTRGHGRESIAEVITFWQTDDGIEHKAVADNGRIHASLPSLQNVGLNTLARAQSGFGELLMSLAKVVMQHTRSLDPQVPLFEVASNGTFVRTIIDMLLESILGGMNRLEIVENVENFLAGNKIDASAHLNGGGSALYLCTQLIYLYGCLFDDKRDRRLVNLPLLVSFVGGDTSKQSKFSLTIFTSFDFILKWCLSELAANRDYAVDHSATGSPPQRVPKTIAAALPQIIAFLRRLATTEFPASGLASVMSRLSGSQVEQLTGTQQAACAFSPDATNADPFFRPEAFGRQMQMAVSAIGLALWNDERLCELPPFLMYPVVCFVADTTICLEEASRNKNARTSLPSRHGGTLLSDWIREQRRSDVEREESRFEPSEDAIARLVDMGFTREHALDALESVQSNHIELAMEHALSHPPPSAGTSERRRLEREDRARLRESSTQAGRESTDINEGNENDDANGNDSRRKSASSNVASNAGEGRDKQLALLGDEHRAWLECTPRVCCDLLCNFSRKRNGTTDSIGEDEATSVIFSSFLLDFSSRYPDVRRDVMVSIASRLQSCVEGPEAQRRVRSNDARTFSALCHTAVLFVRALPQSRVVLLEVGFVTALISCLDNLFALEINRDGIVPVWVASGLLLLDVLSQPMVAFSPSELKDIDVTVTNADNDLQMTKLEHAKQIQLVADCACQMACMGVKSSAAESKESFDSDMREALRNAFLQVPAYFPTLPQHHLDRCLHVCTELLKLVQQADKRDLVSPGVMQAGLLLLLRLLRSPEVASKCLRDGVAEAIFRIPPECKFTGNSGLVTLLLRRLLEDEKTLEAAMESEIRATLGKLHSRQAGGPSTPREVSDVPLLSVIEATTPLLCRHPKSFIQAWIMSTKLTIGAKGDGTDSSVRLLSSLERIASHELDPPENGACRTINSRSRAGRDDSPGVRRATPSKSKSPHRSQRRKSSSKRSKKGEKRMPQDADVSSIQPPAVVTSLLICHVLSELHTKGSEGVFERWDDAFLWTGDYLDILADLVLAIPACSMGVHNFRISRGKLDSSEQTDFAHALRGATAPPRTFVAYLLHVLLPQDRLKVRNELLLGDQRSSAANATVYRKKRLKSLQGTLKLAQCAARVLIALVARPGEGRKRVISDLAFGFSGGRLGHGSTESPNVVFENVESLDLRDVQVLLAWGELALAFIAPKSNGKSLDGLGALSLDIIRLMMEVGMTHALQYALHIVRLDHPLSVNTCCALLVPLELLSRPSVNESIRKMAHKTRSKSDATGDAAGDDAWPQQWMEDTVQAEGQDAHDDQDEVLQPAEFDQVHGDLAAGDMEIDEDDIESEEDESSEDVSDEDASSEQSDDDEISDDDDSSDVDDSDGIHEEVDGAGWDVNYEDAFLGEGDADQDDIEDTEEDGIEVDNPAAEDGWTRIESLGFGGMLVGGQTRNDRHEIEFRSRGFSEAAEAVLGTLLQSGELNANGTVTPNALAEIENSFERMSRAGLPIPGGASGLLNMLGAGLSHRRFASNRESHAPTSNAISSGADAVGTFPHVHQRRQTDLGYSTFGNGGRLVEMSSMEYVYGGPAVTSGNRNFDIFTPIQNPQDHNIPSGANDVDLSLFPGGPVAAASARTQYSLHPLLCGVDLPPVNSLVSDIISHNERATRRGEMMTRRPGEWVNTSSTPGSFLVSTSNGNIIRSSRSHSNASLGINTAQRSNSGPVGWTDDGLPFDSTVASFRRAFEAALVQAARGVTRPDTNGTGNDMAPGTDAQDNAAVPETNSGENEADADAPSTEEQINVADSNPSASSTSPNEGDRVASSLAEGLRLSSDRRSPEPDEGEPDGEAAQLVSVGGAELTDRPVGTGIMERDVGGTNDHSLEEDNDEIAPNGSGEGATPAPAGEEADVGLTCPPEIEQDVFNSLPREMQQECVDQYRATQQLAAELDGSALDPEVLAALPEEMRREIIEQDRLERERLRQEETPADPSRAQEMDNASFVASLTPELRAEILMQADDTFLGTLPPDIVAEAQLLRERGSSNQRGRFDDTNGTADDRIGNGGNIRATDGTRAQSQRRLRTGKFKVEHDRDCFVDIIPNGMGDPLAASDIEVVCLFLFLLSPIRPARLLQRIFQNIASVRNARATVSNVLLSLLHDDGAGARSALMAFASAYESIDNDWRLSLDGMQEQTDFPPRALIGAAPDLPEDEACNLSLSASLLRRRQGLRTAASFASNVPNNGLHPSAFTLPGPVPSRILDVMTYLCKNSQRFCFHCLANPISTDAFRTTTFESLLDLLDRRLYAKSAANLDQLLSLLECIVVPLSHLTNTDDEHIELSQREIDAARASGKEVVDVPPVLVSQRRLQLLCSVLGTEVCREAAFGKVNTIVRRLCRVERNRGFVLGELGAVALALGTDALRDMKSLHARLEDALKQRGAETVEIAAQKNAKMNGRKSLSGSVTLTTSTGEMKLLRVLQTLQALCADGVDENGTRRGETSIFVNEELVLLLRQLQLDELWDSLSSCLKIVQIFEGVSGGATDEKDDGDADGPDDEESGNPAPDDRKLRNTAAGLLTRFLPSIEAFYVVNASAVRDQDSAEPAPGYDVAVNHLVGGQRVLDFTSSNRVVLNAVVRNNPGLLDKGLRALVQVPRCRSCLHFDVKRLWFKGQVRRVRQHASRRHGSLRLHIRRKFVFEDAYHQLRLRNADEMRGRLHITFRNEEGVDAGGLSREFFGILAKEMFNPNYALFTSTEDGCTFQPNPNSSVNPDHLSYFRFVGRIVGKAVADGYLLDAHFTRSLYKHMLGVKPTHHDMEAIDPDYYRNLQTILDYNLDDIGLDLTFSIENHSFGRSKIIDLKPNGRAVPVTEDTKEEYVQLVCQHRMTTAIESQIRAYLDGFYEMVSRDLIAIFTPKELELLISGLPDIDVVDLKLNTDYVGWKASDKEIQWFWNILMGFSRNDKAAFLQFVTGSSKVPLAGFAELQGMRGVQKFSMHKVEGRKGALMSAHTCFNSLDIPTYSSEDEMKEKLLLAINEGAGAFLFA